MSEGSKASHRLTFTIAGTKQLYGGLERVLLKRDEQQNKPRRTGRTLFNTYLPAAYVLKGFLNTGHLKSWKFQTLLSFVIKW